MEDPLQDRRPSFLSHKKPTLKFRFYADKKMMFHCSYCKTNGHFTRNCLKLLTKNCHSNVCRYCHSNVCRDFNRYEVSKCEIDGTCVFNRAHTCLFCNEPNCEAYLHIDIQDAGSPNIPKKNANIIKALTNPRGGT